MLPQFVRDYAMTTICGAPDVLERLLAAIAPDDPVWNRRPDPARFTLCEIAAHLADWNGVYLDRFTRIRDEETPRLLVRSPEDIGRKNASFTASPAVSLARFREGRAELSALIRGLEPSVWERTGDLIGHPQASGAVSLEAWVMALMGHDGYHFRQIAEWLKT